ncbi:ICE-like protease (caspase) p20 domain protein [Ceratobasidium sp. AG-Ba]|nr:ICE-like protease (caspase) p20 domain protein [Ceratobasidium sp. AG-Ba]
MSPVIITLKTVQANIPPAAARLESQATSLLSHLTSSDASVEPEEDFKFQVDFLAEKWDADIHSTGRTISSPKYRALVLALAYPGRYPPTGVRGAYVDAYRVIQLLTTVLGYPEEDIHVLADVPDHNNRIDPQYSPSKDNIEKGLVWLSKDSKPGDHRFLYVVGRAARGTAMNGSTVEGLMPDDVRFRRYLKCEGCQYETQDQAFLLPTREQSIVDPTSVVWNHTINNILADHLADGVSFTGVFECDSSDSTLIHPWDHSLVKQNARSNCNLASISPLTNAGHSSLVPLLQNLALGHGQGSNFQGSNYLCLPKRIYPDAHAAIPEVPMCHVSVFNSSSMDVDIPEQSQSVGLSKCACTLRVRDCDIKPFGRNCRIHADTVSLPYGTGNWEAVLQDQAFTELLKLERTTYDRFNALISDMIAEWSNLTQSEQTPQFYVSDNSTSVEKHFGVLVDI